MKQKSNPHEEGAQALKQARDAARRGDLAAATHWSKIADQMSRAAERLAANPPPKQEVSWEEEEAVRAELRRRIQRFAEHDLDIQRWEEERDVHAAALERSIREGLPPPAPLRMHPAGPLAHQASQEEAPILVAQSLCAILSPENMAGDPAVDLSPGASA